MIKVIKESKHTKGVTAIGKALNMTLADIIPKMRSGVIRLVILATDGTNNVWPAPILYADKIKKEDVRLICIGIGNEINTLELQLIASENSLVLVASYSLLQEEMSRVLAQSCRLTDPIPLQPCTIHQQDLVFLIDSSSSLSEADFIKSKEIVKGFVGRAKLGNDATRISMISFSESVRLDFDIDAYSVAEDYYRAIDGARKFGSATAIGAALDKALKAVLPKRRVSIPFNIVLITDGVNNVYPVPNIPAKELKAKGATIISVAIGEYVDFQNLREISSNNRILTVTDPSELINSIPTVERVVTCG